MDQIQLRDLEAQCIQECAPACSAACPLHVDARGICSAVAQGDFSGGLQILKKTMPFPAIVCRICEQPCRNTCLRQQPLEMAALEHACVAYGEPPEEKAATAAKRKQRVAVIGSGLCGLTAAYDLTKKRYPVVIFEAGSVAGGRLRNFSESQLPRSVLESELSQLSRLGVEFRLNSPVSAVYGSGAFTISELQHEFDAVLIATGADDRYGLGSESAGLGTVDAQTCATAQPGIFAGFGVGRPENPMSLIMAMAYGRIAAVTMDRHVQRVSLTASRVNEGPYESCLYTNTEGVAFAPAVALQPEGYSQAQAKTEAARCLTCECMECVKACEYLASLGGYPKKYARSIYNNLSIVMGTRQANKLINSCSLCGQCAEICPTHMDMGAICKQARQTMVAQGHMPPSAHDFALRDMAFSNSEHFAMTRPQPGKAVSRYVFFPGCQLSGSAPDQVDKTYRYLREHLDGVALMLRCCGAPAEWAGRNDLFQAALAEFKQAYDSLGKPKMILACSSCYQVFKQNLPGVEICSLWEIMDQQGFAPEAARKNRGVIAIHDPCSTRHETEIHQHVRRLVQQAGYSIEELPLNREKTSCCSFGGDTWLANPQLSRQVIQRRINESPRDYLTYCAMCRDLFASQGKPTLHLLDLIFESDLSASASRKSPGYSQRHENRAHLKQKMLKSIWGEETAGQSASESIRLVLSETVQQRIDARLILIEDIQQVLAYAESSGNRLKNPHNGHLVAHYRPNSLTYWVEYAPQDGAFEIFNAYSHRMEIQEGAKR
jgi:Fe-S oxidoreductase/thioredoxin reductase